MRAATFWLMALSSHKSMRSGSRSASGWSGAVAAPVGAAFFGLNRARSVSQNCAGLTGLASVARTDDAAAGRVSVRAQGHEQHQRHHRRSGQFVDFRRQRDAVHVRHVQIQNGQIILFAVAQPVERLLGRFRRSTESFPTCVDLLGQHTADSGVVVHYQKPQVGQPGWGLARANGSACGFGMDVDGEMER